MTMLGLESEWDFSNLLYSPSNSSPSNIYLINLGVYPDPKKPFEEAYKDPKLLNNHRLDWFVVKDDFEFSISEEDSLLLLREVTLPSIEFVLEAMSDGTLPNLDAAKKFLASTQSLSSKLPNSATACRSVQTLPTEHTDVTSQTLITSLGSNNANNIDEDRTADLNSAEYQSMYQRNNVTMDMPLKGDLNSIIVVEAILDYYIDISDRCLKQTEGSPTDDLFGKKHTQNTRIRIS
jgi:hypothetical protein